MTRANFTVPAKLEGLIDEYYEEFRSFTTAGDMRSHPGAGTSRKPPLRSRSGNRTPTQHHPTFTEFLSRADGYLCELKEAQIRDGLHILGVRRGDSWDLIVAIARHPSSHIGLTRALAQEWDFDPSDSRFKQSILLTLLCIRRRARYFTLSYHW